MNHMNKVLYTLLFLITSVLLISCIEINGSGYSDLTESEKQHVKKCTTNLSTLQNDGNLYQITADQVQDDHQVYGTDNYQEYSDKFYLQLIGVDGQSRGGTYHLFSDGSYVRSFVSLLDL